MTTFTIFTSKPAAGMATTGTAAKVDSGLRIDDTVQGASGVNASLLDDLVGSTTAIKLGKYLAHLQRTDKQGREYWATSDAGATYIPASF